MFNLFQPASLVFGRSIRCLLCLALALGWLQNASATAFDLSHTFVSERAYRSAGKTRWALLLVRSTFFREMAKNAQSVGCEANLPPEPLATPDPVLNSSDHVHLTVSFVVGRDGHVYGPMVLEGARNGIRADLARPVVDAVRQWRFRPAVCNGAPAEAEAKVEFSSPRNRF